MFRNALFLLIAALISGCIIEVQYPTERITQMSDTVQEELVFCSQLYWEWHTDLAGCYSTDAQSVWNIAHEKPESAPITRCVDALHFQTGNKEWNAPQSCHKCEACILSDWQDTRLPQYLFGSCKSIQEYDCDPCAAKDAGTSIGPSPWCDGDCVLGK